MYCDARPFCLFVLSSTRREGAHCVTYKTRTVLNVHSFGDWHVRYSLSVSYSQAVDNSVSLAAVDSVVSYLGQVRAVSRGCLVCF